MQIYSPRESFVARVDGVDIVFKPSHLIEEGHPILRAHPEMFVPAHIHFKAPAVESATAAPGEKRKR